MGRILPSIGSFLWKADRSPPAFSCRYDGWKSPMVPYVVWQDKVFDDALLCVRVVVQKEGQYVLTSAPSV
jgi:hypothetical protein